MSLPKYTDPAVQNKPEGQTVQYSANKSKDINKPAEMLNSQEQNNSLNKKLAPQKTGKKKK